MQSTPLTTFGHIASRDFRARLPLNSRQTILPSQKNMGDGKYSSRFQNRSRDQYLQEKRRSHRLLLLPRHPAVYVVGKILEPGFCSDAHSLSSMDFSLNSRPAFASEYYRYDICTKTAWKSNGTSHTALRRLCRPLRGFFHGQKECFTKDYDQFQLSYKTD